MDLAGLWSSLHYIMNEDAAELQQALALNNMHLVVFIYIAFLCKLAIYNNKQKRINLLMNLMLVLET